MKKLTLVILAAGMGSRYGGLKQMDQMNAHGDTIIDFSVYDAIQAGFSKIVFVIRESFKDDFKQLFDKKLEGKIEVTYACQEVNAIPMKFLNAKRTKPWGTGHALLMAKEEVDGNFAVINADDFYGKEAYIAMAAQLRKTNASSSNFCMVGYLLKNTVSAYGGVSRGHCYLKKDSMLDEIVERTHIERENEILYYKDKEGGFHFLEDNTIVSMNFWGFTSNIFSFLDREFESFLRSHGQDVTAEFYIPSLVDTLIKTKEASVQVLTSEAKWLGVTYKEDKPNVEKEIMKLKKNGIYPDKLW